MKDIRTIALPTYRVNALAAETGKAPELAIAELLSVLYSRKMWAHYQGHNSSESIFIYGQNVPTSKRRTS